MGNKFDGQGDDLKQLYEDVAYIKKAVSKKNNILNFMEINQALRFAAFLSGVLVIITALILYFLVQQYGSFALFPDRVKIFFYLYLFLAFVSIAVIKLRNFLSKAREVNSRITFGELIDEVYTVRFIEIIIPFMVVLIAVPIYLNSTGLNELILPFTAMLFGLLSFAVSGLLQLRILLLLAGWLILCGLVFLFAIPGMDQSIQLLISFGCGLLIMGLSGYITSSKKE